MVLLWLNYKLSIISGFFSFQLSSLPSLFSSLVYLRCDGGHDDGHDGVFYRDCNQIYALPCREPSYPSISPEF